MSYIKKTIQLSCFLWLFSCVSNNAPHLVTQSSEATAESLAKELTLYKNAIIALNNNELKKAQQLFTEMSVLQPDMAGSWANLALINIKNKELKEAQKNVEIALSKNDKMSQSWNLLGYLALQNGKIKVAEQHYQQAIKIKPDYALAHYNLALLYDIYLQNISKAAHHYQEYLSNINTKDQETEDWLQGLKATLEINT